MFGIETHLALAGDGKTECGMTYEDAGLVTNCASHVDCLECLRLAHPDAWFKPEIKKLKFTWSLEL